jgi:hypothetical protein
MPYASSVRQYGLPWAHESTRFRPSRDSDDVRQQWKRERLRREQMASLEVGQQQLSRRIEQTRRRILGGSASAVTTTTIQNGMQEYVIDGVTGNNASIYYGNTTVTVNGQTVTPHFILVRPDPSLGIVVASGPPLPCLIPYKLWAIPTETVDGNAVTYSNYNDNSSGQNAQTRTAMNSVTSETQIIVPRYLVGDVIWCMNISTTWAPVDTSPIASGATMLMDINVDSRAWSQQ